MIFPAEPMVVYMVLGSCVAVVLYDRQNKFSGCCHFIVPRTPKGDLPKPKHGIVAVLNLIRFLEEKGADIGNLEAQVIGGGDLPGHSLGKENADAAVKILKKKGVHITSLDVGGEKGRKVIYNTDTNHLAVVKVEKIREDDWYPPEETI
jgi:chemotaxis protein CheD